MAQVSEIHLAHTPPSVSVFATLFKDVQNASFLREQLIAGNTDFEYAFVDATMILSSTHILASVFRSVNDMLHSRLKSRNVHSEIVFNLSPTNNIADSFRRFGVTDSTKHLLAIKIGADESQTSGSTRTSTSTHSHFTLESVTSHLASHVQGESVPFTDAEIMLVSNIAAIRKVYKLGNTNAADHKKAGLAANGASDQQRVAEEKEMETAVLAMMALKGA